MTTPNDRHFRDDEIIGLQWLADRWSAAAIPKGTTMPRALGSGATPEAALEDLRRHVNVGQWMDAFAEEERKP
jgi:hypothetical protein